MLSNRQIAQHLKLNGPISKAAKAHGDDFATLNFIQKMCPPVPNQEPHFTPVEIQGRNHMLTDEIKEVYQRDGQVDFTKFRIL